MKRLVTLVLSLMMILSLLPTASLAENADGPVYVESVVALPEGFVSPSAITGTPSGGLALAAKRADTGAWALLTWSDMNAAPEVLDLAYEGNDIERISIAPDGELVAALSVMPPLERREGPAGVGEAQEGGPVMIQGGDAPAQDGEPVMIQGGDAPAQEGGPVMIQGGDTPAQDGGPVMIQGGDAPAEGQGVMMQDELPPEQAQAGGSQGEAPAQEGRRAPIIRGGLDSLKTTMIWFDQEGAEASRFEIEGMPLGLAALDGRNAAMIGMQSGVTIYDEGGEATQTLVQGMAEQLAAHGDTLYVIEEGKLTAYDVKSGQKQGSIAVSTGTSRNIAVASDGTVYLLSVEGMYTIDPALTEMRQVAGAVGNMFGDPGNEVSGMAVLAGGTVATLINEGGGSGMGGGRSVRIGGERKLTLVLYRPDAELAASGRQDFTITALRNSSKLQKAAGDFQRSHPELNVILQTQMSADDQSPAEDHIRTLNTDLLAGKGGDVLVLDGLPMEKYAQRGMLVNLKDAFADAGLLSGIQSASVGGDGGMYAIPTQFSLSLIWGKKSLMDTLTDLTALSTTPLEGGQTPMAARTYAEWVALLYPSNAPAFTDESGKPDFESEAFARFLEALYQLYTNQGELPPDEMGRGGISPAEIISIVNGATAIYPMQVNSLAEMSIAYTITGATDSGFLLPLTVDGQSHTYTPSLSLGIGSQSKNQALAEEFIRLMLSPEIQELEQMEGLPTVAASLDKLFADAVTRSQDKNISMMFSFDGGNPIEAIQPDEDTLNRLRALCDTLDQPIQTDSTLIGFIVDETDAFFSGQVDAQEAARAIQERAWSYLNE